MTGPNGQEQKSVASESASSASPITATRDRAHSSKEIDDRELASFLAGRALVEIRYLAGRARQLPEEVSPADALDRIGFLANLCHNMPSIARPHAWPPSRGNAPRSTRERAMAERPMSWTWNTSGPEGRAWIVQHTEQAGYRWTPPPPLPTARNGVPALSTRQRISLLTGWPVKNPSGRQPLPRQARVLKALDRESIYALFEEAGRLRLGLGKSSPWLRAHLDPNAPHFIFPDPAAYYWPDPESGQRWWQCRVLLQMVDGEQVSDALLAVLPETFIALPSTISRFRQRRLAHIARATERDSYLWSRDHEADCSPEQCGYVPTEGTTPS